MTDNLITSENPFTEDERQLIAALAEMNIAESDEFGMPGASDPQILANIFARAAGALPELRQGLGQLSSILEAEGEPDPSAVSPERLASLMSTHPALRGLDRSLMMIVAQAYYQDARVLRSLGLADRPPFPQGHEVEEGDWSLLDRVRNGGRKYREVS